MASVSNGVTALGYGLIAYLSTQFLQFCYFHLRPSSLPRYGKKHRLYKATSPTWALVTGASDGLGLALAHEFASSGFNVVIHGRNQAKLNGLKSDIESKHQVQVRTLVVNAGQEPIAFDEASYAAFDKAVHAATADIPLTILVNNIGIIGDWHTMADSPPAYVDESININVRFSVQLTRVLLPTLTRNSPALILNVSSQSDAAPIAYAAMYTGAKGWGLAFHRSLKYEMSYEHQDVEVQTVSYGFIATASTGRTDQDVQFGVVSPQKAAKAALDKIGCGYSDVTPVFEHQFQGWVAGLLPVGVKERAVASVMFEQRGRMLSIAKER